MPRYTDTTAANEAARINDPQAKYATRGVTVSGYMWDAFREAADRDGSGLSEAVREALAEWMAKRGVDVDRILAAERAARN